MSSGFQFSEGNRFCCMICTAMTFRTFLMCMSSNCFEIPKACRSIWQHVCTPQSMSLDCCGVCDSASWRWPRRPHDQATYIRCSVCPLYLSGKFVVSGHPVYEELQELYLISSISRQIVLLRNYTPALNFESQNIFVDCLGMICSFFGRQRQCICNGSHYWNR
jgi:hypothetical protein